MHRTERRRGSLSPVFYVGLVLWVAAFAGIYFLRAQFSEDEPTPEELAGEPGVVQIEKSEPAAGELDVDVTGDARVLKPGEKAELTWDSEGIDDFRLTDQTGREVTNDDLLGQPAVFGFIFTRCHGPCPTVTKALYDLQEATPDLDVRFVTVTVDPEFDTVERLKQYSETYVTDPQRWLFLTGDRDAIYELITQSFKMPVKKVPTSGGEMEYDVLHTSNLMLVDAEGVVRGKYNAVVPAETTKLRARLHEMARDENSGKDAEP